MIYFICDIAPPKAFTREWDTAAWTLGLITNLADKHDAFKWNENDYRQAHEVLYQKTELLLTMNDGPNQHGNEPKRNIVIHQKG